MLRKKILPIVLILLLCSSLVLAQYATLERGASGDEVRRLQEALKSLGYSVRVDGHFKFSTYKAVLKFQKKQGLKADGKAGNATLEKLYALAADSAGAANSANNANNDNSAIHSVVLPTASLRLNDNNSDVKNMQYALKKLG